MNSLNFFTKAAMATLVIVGLAACGSKKGGSAPAAATTASTTCPASGINPYNSALRCTPNTIVYQNQTTGTQTTCPPEAVNPYTGAYCTPGSIIYQTQNTGGGDQCQVWYGPGWYTTVYQGQLVCMRQ